MLPSTTTHPSDSKIIMADDTKCIDDFELIELMSFKPSDCFYGDLRAEFVQDRLTKAGEFLLRCSPLGDAFIVSLKTKNQMRHFSCIQQKQGDNPRSTFDTEHSFRSFEGLVQFHYINRIPLEKGNPETLLSSPVPVPEYRFDENDIDVIRKVGAGAYGDVFKVKIKSANVFLAMKTLKGDVSDAEKENFLKEVQMMKCMRHKNIVRFIGVVTSRKPSKHLQILLEYVNLSSLERLLRRGKVQLRGKHKIGYECALGVEYLHNREIIHRDIASRNILIMMTAGGIFTVKVGDFGLSRTDETGRGYQLKNARKLPLKWMAPENFEKQIWTKSSDVWSFGILLWEIFSSAKEPYSDPEVPQSPFELSQYICAGHTNTRPSDACESIYTVMKSCWHVDPSRRPLIRDIALQLGLILQLFVVSTKKAGDKGKIEESFQTPAKSLQNA